VNLTYSLALTLNALASGHSYGFDIMEATGLPSGTVYPLLRRLERNRLVETTMDAEPSNAVDGRSARRHYRLTTAGRAALVRCSERFGTLDLRSRGAMNPAPRPAQ
jgi:DNA-binding PadR family transcriptional regulator